MLGFLFPGLASERFVVEKNSLMVTSPEGMRGKHDSAAIGNFGVPQYGGSMAGTVVYPKNSGACEEFFPEPAKPGALPTFLLDRSWRSVQS